MSPLIWVGENAWILFGLYAASFAFAAACLLVHMRMTPRMRGRLSLVLAACILAGVGCVLGGMQAGRYPVWPPHDTIPWVRVFWSSAAVLVIIECVRYLMFLRREGLQ